MPRRGHGQRAQAALPDFLFLLFDGHRQPSDQPRDFFQALGIVSFDRLSQPHQAFVIT
jgi:hypothetical protein